MYILYYTSFDYYLLFVGLVHVGDEICEINGTNVQGRDPKDVVQLLVCILLYYLDMPLKREWDLINLIYLIVSFMMHKINITIIQSKR